MSDKKRTSQTVKPSSDLEDLDRRLEEARNRREDPEKRQDNGGSMLGMAWRLSTELVVAVLVGAGLGFYLDRTFETSPWILMIGLVFGFAAGILSVLRTAGQMDAANAHVPIGEDMPDDDEEELD